jgi:uncharacterized membrane protein YgdD (TMEM256/DUF423 family)
MLRSLLVVGAASAAISVAAGAFGAHALRSRLEPAQLVTFETAARYQMYHALGILLVCALAERLGARAETAGWLFVAGTVLFSGSLYALVLTNTRWLGAITPLGGLAFLAGWVVLAVAALRTGR